MDVRRARNLYTVVAAFLVFIGVTGLMTVSDAAIDMRVALNDADPALSEQVSNTMIKWLLILTGVATLMVAVGHGLTSHALERRRPWSRPLGLTFSGILLGLAAVNLLSGAQVMPSFFFALAGMLGISLMSRPDVREYLRPRWGGPQGPRGPGGPQGPGGPGLPPGPPLGGPPPGPPMPGPAPHEPGSRPGAQPWPPRPGSHAERPDAGPYGTPPPVAGDPSSGDKPQS